MKILHFAPENFAGLPATLVRAERAIHYQSSLITLYKNPRKITEEDYCFDVPCVATAMVSALRRLLASERASLTNRRRDSTRGVPVWQPENLLVRFLFGMRDMVWERKIRKTLRSIKIDTFDAIVLDGGVGFLRSSKIIKELQAQGKKIITCYYGSDLRTRGVIPAVEKLAEARFTFEFDHTLLYPELTFLFFPFQLPSFKDAPKNVTRSVRIGHAPTNRAAKGTKQILAALQEIQKKYPVEIVLIENLPYREALTMKSSCDIFVDTIGELGYGINSLEALAMGIPTAVQLLPDFERLLGEHPFVNVSEQTLVEQLTPLVASKEKRVARSKQGCEWLVEHHTPVRVAEKIWRSSGI